MKILIIFIVLNILNVIIQTVKSLVTVKCGKISASLINALAYGLYTIVLVYMSCELSTGAKALTVALCNLVGVYVVKAIEEKAKKEKIWKIETVVSNETYENVSRVLKENSISFNTIDIDNKKILNIFAYTQADSAKTNEIFKVYNIKKYFISETKSF